MPEEPAAPQPPRAYLDNACMGRVDADVACQVRRLVTAIEHAEMSATEFVVDLYQTYPRARARVAALVNVEPERIALVESTSHALGLVAAALPLEAGDNVLVCDLEFCPSVLCWTARRETLDFEVRRVPNRNGRFGAADFERLLDGRTRAIVVSAVQEINGFRADVQGLCRIAHACGVLVIVDGVQEVGCLAVDLSGPYEECPDVYAAGGHKWLRNPFGMGFMCVHPHALERLRPPFYAYFNAAEPEGGWGEYLASPARSPFDRLEMLPGAQRFETGSFGNFLGAAALAASVEKQLELGVHEVEARTMALRARLVEGLDRIGVEVRSNSTETERSGITAFGLLDGPREELAFNEYLRSRRVYVSVRYTTGAGGVRVSPHYYNTYREIDNFLKDTARWCKGRAKGFTDCIMESGRDSGPRRQSEPQAS